MYTSIPNFEFIFMSSRVYDLKFQDTITIRASGIIATLKSLLANYVNYTG